MGVFDYVRAGGLTMAAFEQMWDVAMVDGSRIWIQFSGWSPETGLNTFAKKHLLSPSKKGTSARDKMQRKLWNRGDARDEYLEYRTAKIEKMARRTVGTSATVGIGRNRAQVKVDAYGPTTTGINTVIDLNRITKQEMLVAFRDALCSRQRLAIGAGEDKTVTVRFGKECVAALSNDDDAARYYKSVRVKVHRRKGAGDPVLEVVHLERAV